MYLDYESTKYISITFHCFRVMESTLQGCAEGERKDVFASVVQVVHNIHTVPF